MNKELEKNLQYLDAFNGIHKHCKERCLNNANGDSFKLAINFPVVQLGKKVTKAEHTNQFFDEIYNVVERGIFINCYGILERTLFEATNIPMKELRNLASLNYDQKNGPYANEIEHFIKDHKVINKVSDIKGLVESKMPPELFKKFIEIIKYRDRIAHGDRFGEVASSPIKKLIDNMDTIIDYIHGNV